VIKKHYKYKTIFVRKNQQAHQNVFTLLLKSPVTNAKINNAEGTWAIGLVENPPNSINLLKNEFRVWIRRVSQVYWYSISFPRAKCVMIGNQIWANSYKKLVNKTLNERMWQGISQKKPTIERMWQGIFQKKPALRNESDLIAFSCNAYKLQLPDWKRNFQEQFHLQFNSIKNIHSVKNWMATKDFYIHAKRTLINKSALGRVRFHIHKAPQWN